MKRFLGPGSGGAALALVLLTSCAPGTPDEDSWRADAQGAVSDSASAVRTTEKALELRTDDGIFDHYLQTMLVDAEKLSGMASDSLASEQPPAAEEKRYDSVTAELDDAASLIATVRIAVVKRDSDQYAALAKKLQEVSKELNRLDSDLEHPPSGAAEVSRP